MVTSEVSVIDETPATLIVPESEAGEAQTPPAVVDTV